MWQRRESDDEAAVHERLARVLRPAAPGHADVDGLRRAHPPLHSAGNGDGQGSDPGHPAGVRDDGRGGARRSPGGPGGEDGPGGTGHGPALLAGHGPAPLAGPGSPRALLAGALDPGRRGVRALAAVAAVVVVVAAVLAWQARPRVEPVATAAGLPAGAAVAVSPTALVVAVAGRVRRPGLVHLPAGARVADAIGAAGGALPGTDLSLVNLARRVADGELVVVGVTPPPGAAGAPDGGGLVNLNTATLAQLDQLPGVGPVLAQRILDYRDSHGGFRSVAELRQVDGVGDTRYEQLKSLVTV